MRISFTTSIMPEEVTKCFIKKQSLRDVDFQNKHSEKSGAGTE